MGIPEEERTHGRIPTRHDTRYSRRRDLLRQRGRHCSNFKKSGIMFHPCQNPSVYTDPSGKLRMLANAGSNGIWESESVDGGWRCISPGFPPGGDCTFFFRWGKFDYIIGGFTGLWSKPADAPNSAYEDVVRKGLDFYDGSNVPSITEITGGRFLMAGVDSNPRLGRQPDHPRADSIPRRQNRLEVDEGNNARKQRSPNPRGEGCRNDDIPVRGAGRSC